MSLLQYVFLGVFFLFVVVLPYYYDKRVQQRIQEKREERRTELDLAIEIWRMGAM